MVQDAQGAKLPIQGMVDRITAWFVPAVMAVAAVTVLAWLVFGGTGALGLALVAGVSVLIIACPCAMGLATPTSIMVGTGRAAEMGLLFRKGQALQTLSDVDVVAFDKTGTLTEGRPELTDIALMNGFDRDTVIAAAAGVESMSEHPIARAITRATSASTLKAKAFRTITGQGVEGKIEGVTIRVGSGRLMKAAGIDTTPLDHAAETFAKTGQSAFFVSIGADIAGVIAVSDPLKPSSIDAIRALHTMGIKVAMITGDSQATADAIAARLGIDHVVSDALPETKVEAITTLAANSTTAFVGDGINDAPALATADIGIAIGTGTDVAVETADLVLMSGDTGGVVRAIDLSRATMRNIRQNLGWAFGYNVLLIPVAAGALYPLFGTMLSPMLAAGAMALSSVAVVTNALRLRGHGRQSTPPTSPPNRLTEATA